jgi:hypothetical protein
LKKLSDTVGAEIPACQQPHEVDPVLSDIAAQTPEFSIDALEAEMLACPQIECPIQHHFGPGVYIREGFMPAGTYAIGHAHKHDHMNIILSGKAAVVMDGEVRIITGPYIFNGKPGRKVSYFLEDTVWLNIHPTDETDIEKLEEIFVDKSDAWKNAKEDLLHIEAINAAVRKSLKGVN